MSLLDIEPVPGASEDGTAPIVGTPIQLERLSSGVRLRLRDGSSIGVLNLVVGDTTPPVRVQVVDVEGNPIDLTGCSAEFHMTPRRSCGSGQNSVSSGHTVSSDATLPSPIAGFLSYEWSSDGSDTVAGSYLARFTIIDQSGDRLTVGNIPIEIS